MTNLLCDEKDITYGQQFLIDTFSKKGVLTQFSKEHNLNFFYLYRTMIGQGFPPMSLIFSLRTLIHPVLWFYTVSEDKPMLKKYDIDSLSEFDYTKSLALQSLQEVDITKLSEKCGVSRIALYKTKTKRSSPTYAKIIKLRDVIYPADWFFGPKSDNAVEFQKPVSGTEKKRQVEKITMSLDEYDIIENARAKTLKTFSRFVVDTMIESITKE